MLEKARSWPAVADDNPTRNPAIVYILNLAVGSRQTQTTALQKMATVLSDGRLTAVTFPWHQLRYVDAQLLRRWLSETRSASTANRYLAALRGVMKQAFLLEQLPADDYQRLVMVQAVRGEALEAGRYVAIGELLSLATICAEDASPAGARDGALLAIAFTSGLRVSEVSALDLSDYDAVTGELLVRRGKGNKQRRAYVAPGAKTAIARWLTVRGDWSGALFVPITQSGIVGDRRLISKAIYERFRGRARQSHIKPISPHDARRTWLSNLLAAGVDVGTAQKLAGHASPVTTTAYDRRGEKTKREAVGKLHWPEVATK